ncbi:hypothetical protein QE152_g33391 [Popillia japonica]|uniref:Reverse transcriptase domain-containing protein n=1 Tax=Popillia japonica TaxID=7064 RepID=A0AAW1IWV9_POPJA
MELDTEMKDEINKHYYLPHLCVIKESSISTKLRVVFNGSSKSSNGISLNDKLCIGPTVQQSLASIVTRFRTHKYVMTADITKMYRQILVHPKDQEYQKILWRNSEDKTIEAYKLQTVTYGTSSASYLATRCLKQLGIDHATEFPIESLIVQTDFYVDDLLTGTNTKDAAIQLRRNITNLLQRGGFQLSKWASNDSEILIDSIATENNIIPLDKDQTIKTLGLSWNSTSDTFQFSIHIENSSQVTKRYILSTISKLFDPLGLMHRKKPMALVSIYERQVITDLQLVIRKVYLWTDSTIVLAWIKSNSRMWKTFVANRVSKIHDDTNSQDWYHVGTKDNPADLITRGRQPLQLKTSTLWWHGPSWLQVEDTYWPSINVGIDSKDVSERKKETLTLIAQNTYLENQWIFTRYSTLDKLLRSNIERHAVQGGGIC